MSGSEGAGIKQGVGWVRGLITMDEDWEGKGAESWGSHSLDSQRS